MAAISRIGVLALQGDFERHLRVLQRLGAETVPVRGPETISGLAGLVIPGGESTTIGMLMERFGLLHAVSRAVDRGMAVFGTCAGAILLAREIENSDQPRLGLMNISVTRNGYGRQIESFEAVLNTPTVGGPVVRATPAATHGKIGLPASTGAISPFDGHPLTAVFIRAPVITRVAGEVAVLAEFESRPVLVQQHRLLAATFHPELTDNTAIHHYFLEMVRSDNAVSGSF